MSTEHYNLEPGTLHLLQQAAQFFNAHNCQAYLVGGSVRDLLLNIPSVDWDIATDGNTPKLARELANVLGAYYAYMNDKACRITVKNERLEILRSSMIHCGCCARCVLCSGISLLLSLTLMLCSRGMLHC